MAGGEVEMNLVFKVALVAIVTIGEILVEEWIKNELRDQPEDRQQGPVGA
jgi:hypothetical protein